MTGLDLNNALRYRWIVLGLLLSCLIANWFFPGEIFYQSRFLFIAVTQLTLFLVLVHYSRGGLPISQLRFILLACLPLLLLALSAFMTINSHRTSEVLWLFWAYTCLFMSLRMMSVGARAATVMVLVVSLAATGVTGVAIYQYFYGLDELKRQLMNSQVFEESFRAVLIGRVESGRIFANFSLPNSLAGFLTMVIPLQLFLIYTSHRCRTDWLPDLGHSLHAVFKSGWAQLLLIMQLLSFLIVLVWTQSYGGLLGGMGSLMVGSALYCWMNRKSLKLVVAAGSGLAALGALCLGWLTFQRGFALWNLQASQNPISLRWINFRTAFSIFLDFPLTGVGLGNYGTINPHYQTDPRYVTQYAHNTPLQLLSECGLLFIALAMLVGLALVKWGPGAVEYFKNKNSPLGFLRLALLTSCSAWLIHNLLDIDLYFPSLGGLGVLLTALLFSVGSSQPERQTHCKRLTAWRSQLLLTACAGALLAALYGCSQSYIANRLNAMAVDAAANQDFEEAERLVKAATNLKDDDASMLVNQARIEVRAAGNTESLREIQLQTLKRAFQEATRLDPFNAEYHFQLSRVLLALGQKGRAREARERAIELFPSEPRFQSVIPDDC